MHTVELLKQACATAQELGYQLRYDKLDGLGGACTVRGQKLLFIDLEQSPADQLELVLAAIAQDAADAKLTMPPALDTLIKRRAA
ncbi:MAG: hypothetical protein JSS27_21440 [Planctomycetes bacterium]|nr:hypothetical protein [Planctomycetota bacterium]